MTNLNQLAREITLREGKKKSISIAQVKEVLGILSDIIYSESMSGLYTGVCFLLCSNGEKRAKRKKK